MRSATTRIGFAVPSFLLAATIALLAWSAPASADFGLQPGGFEASILDSSGAVTMSAPAGGHPPFQRVKFAVNLRQNNYPGSNRGTDGDPDENIKTVITELPPGLLGNPTALPRCSLSDFPAAGSFGFSRCPSNTQVGMVDLSYGLESGVTRSGETALYNLQPPKGVIARLGFVEVVPVIIDISLRTGGDYGLTATSENISQIINLHWLELNLWGIPADPIHDSERRGNPSPPTPQVPFLSNPTRCGVDLSSRMRVASWEKPNDFLTYTSIPMEFTGCDRLDFEPSIEAKPTTNLADAPSGLDFNLHLPQNESIARNEVQSLKVIGNEGNFKLKFDGESTIVDPEYNISAEILQLYLEFMSTIGSGNVKVTGGPGDETGSSPYLIQFKGKFARTDVPEFEVEDGSLQVSGNPGAALITTETPGSAPGEEGSESSTAHLRDATVTLPEGMTVNPPSADVLEACSMDQVGISPSGVANGNPASCPDASILGKATVDSPPIDHPLPATIYLAKQSENPFGSLLAIYLVIDDEDSGLRIKLPGRIDPDPNTGRLTVSFKENPQTPVEDIEMHFFGGPHASLKTPQACGVHTVTSELVPWTAPEGETKRPSSSFALTQGSGGGACVPSGDQAPNQPAFIAGTADPTAKAYSPFVLKLSREDGSQELEGIDTTLPQGLLAKLAGASSCSDTDLSSAAGKSGKAEQASPSCPASSEVGTVDVAAGAGPTPIHVGAKAYLAGPYKGAPLSLVVIAPAVAGPFDLGNVVVRNALHVDPVTAQVRAVSDPFPTILQGIPLDLRSIVLKIDRPRFTFNPTSCEPMSVLGTATSVFGQGASLSSYFQADECGALGFKPKLRLALKGKVSRRAHPSLRATLTARPGDANIARAQVKLPKAAFIDNAHIRNPCTRVQFAADACPKSSVYGYASATSPLIDYTLTGPVYLRSNPAHQLPDLVVAFKGPERQPIEVELAGKTDAVAGALRNTFEAVPDVPVTKFSLTLFGGKRGLIVMSEGFCAAPRASVKFDGHNGRSYDTNPVVAGKCGKGGGKGS